MNTKVLTLVVGMLMLLPAGYAAGQKFSESDCPSGYDCQTTPDDGGVFPPRAVTAHTIFASFVMQRDAQMTLGLPTDFAAIAGYFAIQENKTIAKQRECVVWFDGQNLDQRPAQDNFGADANAFPSDEDQDPAPVGHPNHDESYQDYDFDRDVADCLPYFNKTAIVSYANFAVALEQGDCDPMSGFNHKFRGHLDFVDPNNVYHEVQEYEYECNDGGPMGNWLPNSATIPVTNQSLGDHVEDFFPNTGTDPHNEDGCQMYDNPTSTMDPVNGEAGFFDFGHKCNGSIRDLFTERMWMTVFHDPVEDPTILQEYNFALQIDTCAGVNIYEGAPIGGASPLTGPGKEAMGDSNNMSGATSDPQGGLFGTWGYYHDISYDTWYGVVGDDVDWPLYDTCTDGSSFSFDDTPRGKVVHQAPPAGPGDTAIMRGNSYDFDPQSDTFGKHRTNCRSEKINWPYNDHPGNEPVTGEDCYPEDHKVASIDIYVYDEDPTGGLWAVNTNGLTGPNNAYTRGDASGPFDMPGMN